MRNKVKLRQSKLERVQNRIKNWSETLIREAKEEEKKRLRNQRILDAKALSSSLFEFPQGNLVPDSRFTATTPSSDIVKIIETSPIDFPRAPGIPYYQRVLAKGYLSTQEKLLKMLTDDQPLHPYRKIYIQTCREEIERTRLGLRKLKRSYSGSPRVLRQGEIVLIVYPSGREYKGKLYIKDGLAVVEPDTPNTAAWMLNESDVKISDIDLSAVSHERIIHTKSGVNFLSSFVGSQKNNV